MPLRTFSLYKILWDSNHINNNIFNKIAQKINDYGIIEKEPNRYGFEFVKVHGDYIYGCFAQEYEQSIIEYDDNNNPTIEDTSPFEYYIFIIILDSDEGIIALEQKRISKQKGLMAKTRTNFKKALSDTLDEYIPGFNGFESYIFKFSKEEIIDFFKSNNIIEIKVEDLKNKKIPEELKFFNPNMDQDEFLKSVWGDDFSLIEKEMIKGENLQNTKAAKAAVYTGKTTSLTMKDMGYVKTIKDEIGPTDQLPIDNYDDKDNLNVKRAVEILRTKTWKLTPDEYQHTLEEFEQMP